MPPPLPPVPSNFGTPPPWNGFSVPQRIEGATAAFIPLGDRPLVFGRGEDADVRLPDPSVSRRHAAVERNPEGGFLVRDLASRTGTLINGRLFDVHVLVYGDRLQVGPFLFRFEGLHLTRIESGAGGSVEAVQVTRRFGAKTTLNSVSLRIDPGQFVGILGTSGAGKSTLLDALSGMRTPSSGAVLLNGEDLYRRASQQAGAKAACGYVPQDDIIHRELRVAQGLRYSASLRLPGSIAGAEVDKLVAQTVRQLGLTERVNLVIGRLSGGQRKRVSIAAELLARPPILFLDEPSSGLDPATEFKLMELLRELANTGCTIICTTHVMENVFLMDQVVIVSAGRLVYIGPPKEALEFFGIQRFTSLYDRLEESPAENWQSAFEARRAAAGGAPSTPVLPPPPPPSFAAQAPAADPPNYIAILLSRQCAMLAAEVKNIGLLIGQPIFIGLLAAWIGADNLALKLFVGYLGTLWFGCGNAAQEIVKELPIYRRERLVGLPRHSYLLTKFGFLGVVTSLQAIALYICLSFSQMYGSTFLQVLCVIAMAWASVGIGLIVSVLVKTATQAALIVPLLLLPQILFSGFAPPAFQMKDAEKVVANFIPSYAAQRIMDVSRLWDITPDRAFFRKDQGNEAAYRNLDPDLKLLKNRESYTRVAPALGALTKLFLWCVLSYWIAWFGLKQHERT